MADAAEQVFQDLMEQALVMVAQAKHKARRATKALDWDEYIDDFDSWLDDNSVDIYTAAFLPVFNLIIGGVPTVLTDQLAFNTLFGTHPRPITAEAFWASYAPPFIGEQNETTIEGIKALIGEGLEKGWSNDQIINQLGMLFEQWMGHGINRTAWLSDRTPYNRREMISRSETIRASNAGLETTYAMVGVPAKQWYTAATPCDWCAPLNGMVIDVDQVFFYKGDTYTIGEGDAARSMALKYSDVGYPPLHPRCRCMILPVLVDMEIPLSNQADWEKMAA